MSVDRWLVLLTEEEYNNAVQKADWGSDYSWFDYIPNNSHFDFGDTKDELVKYKEELEKLEGSEAYLNLDKLHNLYKLTDQVINDWGRIVQNINSNLDKRIYFYLE